MTYLYTPHPGIITTFTLQLRFLHTHSHLHRHCCRSFPHFWRWIHSHNLHLFLNVLGGGNVSSRMIWVVAVYFYLCLQMSLGTWVFSLAEAPQSICQLPVASSLIPLVRSWYAMMISISYAIFTIFYDVCFYDFILFELLLLLFSFSFRTYTSNFVLREVFSDRCVIFHDFLPLYRLFFTPTE